MADRTKSAAITAMFGDESAIDIVEMKVPDRLFAGPAETTRTRPSAARLAPVS